LFNEREELYANAINVMNENYLDERRIPEENLQCDNCKTIIP
jgi:hypothetical protein